MARHCILGTTDPVIICTGAPPEVPHMSLSHPVSAFKFFPTCVPVMSESIHAPDTFLIPVKWDGPLRSTYDKDVSTHPSEKLDHCCLPEAPVLTPPPFSVFENLRQYPTCSDAGLFCGMQTNRNGLKVPDPLDKPLDTSVA